MSDTTSGVVRFTRVWSNYIPGDVARFPISMARELVGNRIAEVVHVQPAAPRPPRQDAPAPDGKTPQRQPASLTRK